MAPLHVDPKLPDITPVQSLTGWRREFCVELLGEGGARVFVYAVEKSSFKASELQRAILFHRLDSRVRDLEGCVQAIRPDLDRLIDTARRTRPDRANLFAALEYDRKCPEKRGVIADRSWPVLAAAALFGYLPVAGGTAGGDAAAGARLAAARCSSCHSSTETIRSTVPLLEGQPKAYCVAQWRAFRERERTASASVPPRSW